MKEILSAIRRKCWGEAVEKKINEVRKCLRVERDKNEHRKVFER